MFSIKCACSSFICYKDTNYKISHIIERLLTVPFYWTLCLYNCIKCLNYSQHFFFKTTTCISIFITVLTQPKYNFFLVDDDLYISFYFCKQLVTTCMSEQLSAAIYKWDFQWDPVQINTSSQLHYVSPCWHFKQFLFTWLFCK